MTYKKRTLKFQFTLKDGAFDESGNNILTIDNIKAEIEIGAYGGISGTTLEARGFGLSIENMALLSYKGIQLNGAKQNMMKVWADDRPVFFGSITNCFADLNQMPDAPLIISAFSTGFDQSITAPPFSKEGIASVAEIITTIAASIRWLTMAFWRSLKILTSKETRSHRFSSALTRQALRLISGWELFTSGRRVEASTTQYLSYHQSTV